MSSERAVASGVELQGEPFLYIPTNGDKSGNGEGGAAVAWSVAGSASVKDDSAQREKEAYERGLKEGEALARRAGEQELAALRGETCIAIEKFKAERESYFSKIEPEVVQLALAIARKILHREAQIDPLLLAGLVRVALEKINAGTRVRLWAHPADVHFWNEYFAQAGAFQPAPELIGDATLRRGECRLETEIGSTQISLDTQLKEIEQGFFDLLEHRPRVR